MRFDMIWRARYSLAVLGLGIILLAGTGCNPSTVQEPPPEQDLDADDDGVLDADDNCPGTAVGVEVDANGCAVEVPDTDADDDGVLDADDDCPGTTAGTEVDVNGCPIEVPDDTDDDDDGVLDVDDDCPGTAPGTMVDVNGCEEGAEPPPARDGDGDGVPDRSDDCPRTPPGQTPNENGCGPSERDTDGDGVTDNRDACPDTAVADLPNVDETGCVTGEPPPVDNDADDDGVLDDADNCPNTPAGTEVDDSGCEIDDGGNDPVCGNGTVESGEQCEPPNTATCNAQCRLIGGNNAVCGNGTVEAGEQCEPPNTATCNAQCRRIDTGGIPANNNCADATPVGNGTIEFSNVGATTDGPNEPGVCIDAVFGDTTVAIDVWYIYTATCNGSATVSLCGSGYDTKLAVYTGGECPPAMAIRCSDDNCGVDPASRTTFNAILGDEYLIRIGGFQGEQGDGFLTIHCGNTPTCAGGTGDCFASNDTPTCGDEDCCNSVCEVDQYCCDVEWDGFCADEAEGICGTGFAVCGTSTDSCDTAHPGGGCSDQTCCNVVCQSDPFCCITSWDSACATSAAELCPAFDACVGSPDTCFAEHRDPGCNDETLCRAVCAVDIFCCSTEWDETCVETANDLR